jgi:hypothetical protein
MRHIGNMLRRKDEDVTKNEEIMKKPKTPLRGSLAKQNRVGYTLVDIIVKVYSHPFESIIACAF